MTVGQINTFDFDGVIYLGPHLIGLKPDRHDIIITGRSFEEKNIVEDILYDRGIYNQVYYNPTPKHIRTREQSGQHKGLVLRHLIDEKGFKHGVHFEDDEIQIAEIWKIVPNITIVHIKHELTVK